MAVTQRHRQHLFTRGGTWYLRRRIPVDLASHYEDGFLGSKRAYVYIEFDDQERVLTIRVERSYASF